MFSIYFNTFFFFFQFEKQTFYTRLAFVFIFPLGLCMNVDIVFICWLQRTAWCDSNYNESGGLIRMVK